MQPGTGPCLDRQPQSTLKGFLSWGLHGSCIGAGEGERVGLRVQATHLSAAGATLATCPISPHSSLLPAGGGQGGGLLNGGGGFFARIPGWFVQLIIEKSLLCTFSPPRHGTPRQPLARPTRCTPDPGTCPAPALSSSPGCSCPGPEAAGSLIPRMDSAEREGLQPQKGAQGWWWVETKQSPLPTPTLLLLPAAPAGQPGGAHPR